MNKLFQYNKQQEDKYNNHDHRDINFISGRHT